MREQELQAILVDVAQPREPRPEFRRELRERLLTRGINPAAERADHADQPVLLEDLKTVEPSRRPGPTRRLILIGAAALVALLVGWTAVTVMGSQDDDVVHTTVPKLTVQQACRTFNARAFAEIPRAELLDLPTDALTNHPDPEAVLQGLRAALIAFDADLKRAGIQDPAVTDSLQIAISRATLGVRLAQQGAVTRVVNALKDIEPRLVETQRGLTRLGVPTCL